MWDVKSVSNNECALFLWLRVYVFFDASRRSVVVVDGGENGRVILLITPSV